jgi:hypothetical protein
MGKATDMKNLRDIDIIDETVRQLGAIGIPSDMVARILDYPRVREPAIDDVDVALRRREIVVAVIEELGAAVSADSIYSRVYIAVRNAHDREKAA